MADHGSYRTFRRQVLEHLGDGQLAQDRGRLRGSRGTDSPFAAGRSAISAFRAEVAGRATHWAAMSTAHDAWVRRALRLPPTLALEPGTLATAEKWLFVFLPFGLATRRASRLLRLAGTFEGRALIFDRYVQRTLALFELRYDEAVDFALRWFEPVETWRVYEQVEHTGMEVMRTAHALGLRNFAQVREAFFSRGAPLQRRELVQLLVAEGVVRNVAELAWAGKERDTLGYSYAPVDADEIQRLRGIVRCLLAHGVAREQVAAILRFPLSSMAPDALEANIGVLEAAGTFEVAAVLAQVGDRLWRTPTPTWRFIVDVLDARTPQDLAKFRALLDCHHDLSVDLAQELKLHCAGLDELAGCQRLLAGLDPQRDDAASFVAHVRRLTRAPHSLNANQLARSEAYLKGGDSLPPFLQVLQDHGLGDAASVTEFQRCFRQLTAAGLDRALKTLEAVAVEEPLPQRVDWVLQAGKSGYFHVYDYLIETFRLQGLMPLQQILPLGSLGIAFLRCLIEDRRLDSLKAVRDWYRDAVGIVGYRGDSSYDAADKLLFDDAFDRNHFGLLASNQRAVHGIVHTRIQRSLGTWPWQAEEVEKEAYREASRLLGAQMRTELLPALAKILKSTGGVILESLFEDEGDQPLDLERKLTCLTPLLAELVAGGGPSGTTLTAMQLDAIAVVYRSPQEFIRTKWHEVRGHESHLQGLVLRQSYEMAWRHARRRLRRDLDSVGFHALRRAAQFSENFRDYPNMFTACQRLSPKQLRQNALGASLDTLALHLGSLLALAREDGTVSRWIREGFDELTAMEQGSLGAFQRVGELVDLFAVVLPDALDAHADAFIERLPENDAAHWASRLGPSVPELEGRALLRAVVSRTRAKLLPLHLAWARRQFKLYEQEEDASRRAQLMSGVVSKHPAAYFAKQAAGLCTAGNLRMWEEERHCHLVVFDPQMQRMVGMAMLYVQQIPELDSHRLSLVIRGINPTEEMLASHDTRSIVESFFDAAVLVAQDNNLACVAFPAPSGAHIMSNRDAVEKDLKKRYVARAPVQPRAEGVGRNALRHAPERVAAKFYAYEQGSEGVDALYVIWRPSETIPEIPPAASASEAQANAWA
ncbi:hypothetical protein [Roseateles aquatilis]|jgi:hypothetical protein|nr:hypothetical protein [Roseateles aquatilis]MBY0365356.1 hypothetical protein [Burkholderiaceae bacterium]